MESFFDVLVPGTGMGPDDVETINYPHSAHTPDDLASQRSVKALTEPGWDISTINENSNGGGRYPPDIIKLGLAFIALVDVMNGLYLIGHPPVKGDEFTAAITQFNTAADTLSATIPSAIQWSGSAADAFTAQLEQMRKQIVVLTELDQSTQHGISIHSKLVYSLHFLNELALVPVLIRQWCIVRAMSDTPSAQAYSAARIYAYKVVCGAVSAWFVYQSAIWTSAGIWTTRGHEFRNKYSDAGRAGQFTQ